MTFIMFFYLFVIYFYITVRMAKRSAAVQRESIGQSDEQEFWVGVTGKSIVLCPGFSFLFHNSAFQLLKKNRIFLN